MMQIRRTEGRRLELPLRLAWSSWVVDHVLTFYSSYFRTEFRQADAVEMAWRRAVGGRVNSNDLLECRSAIGAMYDRAESEGYSIESLAMGDELLSEMQHGEGKSAVAAVEYGAAALSNAAVYRLGTSIRNPSVSWQYRDTIAENVLSIATNAFHWAMQHSSERVHRELFNDFCLPDTFAPLDIDSVSIVEYPPPRAEARGDGRQEKGWQ